jgi:hypothetical protein
VFTPFVFFKDGSLASSTMAHDKQLCGIKLADVLEKRRLDQALNIKEFAVLAGISYSVAREWFQIKGFPRVQGVVFWTDFVDWRNLQNGGSRLSQNLQQPDTSNNFTEPKRPVTAGLPARAVQILLEAAK